ncbi:uncharacterized protein [Nicotiana tomentosiformis]|uniref:uncharacterized protein n=1 Tax=Nicotiana tomentosiformis TaxID=4098 RepID=UPI00388C70BA
MWDKLEVTYKGTNKVKETRINLLVRDYELFQMKDGESVEEMFSQFSKIIGDLKSFGKPIRSREHVRKLLRSLSTIWQPKIITLECQDPDKMSYDELRGDLIAFKKTHLDRQVQQEKKIQSHLKQPWLSLKKNLKKKKKEEEEEDEKKKKKKKKKKEKEKEKKEKDKEKGKDKKEEQKKKKEEQKKKEKEQKKNQEEEKKKKKKKNFQKKKSFGAWSDDEESDLEEIANIYFMAIKEYSDEDSDIEKVLHELRKIQREKKDWSLKLEICEIERDMLQEEVHELQLQLNELQKSTSHSSIKSNQSTSHENSSRTRHLSACIHCGKDSHKSNHCRFRKGREKVSANFSDPSCF